MQVTLVHDVTNHIQLCIVQNTRGTKHLRLFHEFIDASHKAAEIFDETAQVLALECFVLCGSSVKVLAII